MQQALLFALLEPIATLTKYENEGRSFERLALLEVMKAKPFGAIWEYFCLQQGTPVGEEYISDILQYEKDVLLKR